MISEALKTVDEFANGRVLVIGDLILDRYLWGNVNRISPEAPVPVVVVERESVHLGGASNVLANLTAMGAKTSIVGVVGRDGNGDELLELLKKSGVETSGVVRSVDHPTIQKTRVIAHQQQVVRVDREKNQQFPPELTDQLIDECLQRVEACDVLIVSDYGKGVIVPRLLRALAQYKELPEMCVDPKDPNFNFYMGSHILTPNQTEAERMSGIPIRDRTSLFEAAKKIFERVRCRHLLITRGEKGMALFEAPGKLFEIPTQAREVFDVSGAGDTVIATYALARAVGAEPRICAYLANVAAGIVVGKLGTAEVTADEIAGALHKERLHSGPSG
jgi:D-beta-D-heptose 7-phosphate kinase/D-beta-D-heptose 1-phosphate adenosyltransferase